MPTVTVLYFAHLKDALERERETFELPAETSAEAILAAVAAAHPEIAETCRVSRVAVDMSFASGPVVLAEGAEVAIIPPVSGG